MLIGDFGVSNIKKVENPPFTLEDFYAIYPQFGRNGDEYNIPREVAQMYLDVANKSLSEKRWKGSWKLGMCLYIAHYCTLYARSLTNPVNGINGIIKSGQVQGLETSVSADGVSVSTDYSAVIVASKNAGDMNLTTFGQQFLSLAKRIPHGFIMAL